MLNARKPRALTSVGAPASSSWGILPWFIRLTCSIAPIAELVLELDRLAIDAMADWKVPGAALAVVQGGKVALARAYGHRNIEADLPATTATQFLIGSITKSFTATSCGPPAQ